jgi:hypothetical protein
MPLNIVLCVSVMEPVDHGLKPLKLWAKIPLSSFKLFFPQVFCHSAKKKLMQKNWHWKYSQCCDYS